MHRAGEKLRLQIVDAEPDEEAVQIDTAAARDGGPTEVPVDSLEVETVEPRHFATRFMIRSGHRIALIRVPEVDSILADGNYVLIHVKGKVHRMRSTIHALEARLDPTQFVRVHKSAIINLDLVNEIQAWYGGDYIALMPDGRKVRVSRTYAGSLLQSVR